MEIVSPLTGTNDVTLLEQIPVSIMKQQYWEDFGFDVSRYFNNIENVMIYKCNKTDYRFYYPFSVEADGSFYEFLMSRKGSAYYPKWRWECEVASEFVNDTNRVLDVGCGDGAFLRGVKDRKKVFVEGLELNQKALEAARASGLSVHNEMVQQFADKYPGKYDVVTSFQVLEHIAEVQSFLSAKVNLLKPGGLMIIGVPFNNPFLYRKDKYHTLNLPPHHMGLWNKTSLENLTKILNVEVVAVKIEKVDDLVYYFFVQLGLVNLYGKLLKKVRIIRFLPKIINKAKIPSSLINGRNIVVVFKKL